MQRPVEGRRATVTLMRSMVAACTSIVVKEPAFSVRLPLTVRVPTELPGAIVPPVVTRVPGNWPVPPRVPPVLTVTPEELAIEPLTVSLPAFTEVAPL